MTLGGGSAPGARAGEQVLVGARGGALVAVVLVVGALLQQRRYMARLELERLADSIELLGAATERLEAAGQVRPQGRVLGIGAGRAREQGLRLHRGAAIEHAHAQFIEHRRVIRRLLRDAGQQPVGFRRAAGRGLSARHLYDSDDGGLIERRRGGGIQGVYPLAVGSGFAVTFQW